jgi:hypothetical protein
MEDWSEEELKEVCWRKRFEEGFGDVGYTFGMPRLG